jgi:hypothetical protein
MIKNTFENLIHKYYLGSLCESVKWVNTPDQLCIKFINGTSNLFGLLTIDNFDSSEFTIGIFDSSKLLKLVKILDDEFIFEVTDKETKIKLQDTKYKIEYTLADINVIPDVPSKVNEPSTWECIFKITKPITKNILQAKKALPDTNIISFNRGGKDINCTIGDMLYNSNKINILLEASNECPLMDNVSYPLDIFSEILDNNDDMNEGTVYISEGGIAKIVFDKHTNTATNIKVTYYLISNQ